MMKRGILTGVGLVNAFADKRRSVIAIGESRRMAEWPSSVLAAGIGVDAVVGLTSEQASFEGRYEGRGKQGSVGRGR